MIGRLRFVLSDQLTRDLASLSDLDPARDEVLLVEVDEEARYVPHHKLKIAFLRSAMRHFAQDLQAEGIRVDYVGLDDPANTHSLTGELARAIARHDPASVVMTEPGEWRIWQMMQGWNAGLGLAVEIRADDRFFCSRAEFAALTLLRKTGRMEYFYREMRRRTGLLMHDGGPAGGQWNFDLENRKALPRGLSPRPAFVSPRMRSPGRCWIWSKCVFAITLAIWSRSVGRSPGPELCKRWIILSPIVCPVSATFRMR